jgi:hypothetical protein
MRKYCDREKIELDILTDLHVVGPPDCEKVVSGMLSVCVCAPR